MISVVGVVGPVKSQRFPNFFGLRFFKTDILFAFALCVEIKKHGYTKHLIVICQIFHK